MVDIAVQPTALTFGATTQVRLAGAIGGPSTGLPTAAEVLAVVHR